MYILSTFLTPHSPTGIIIMLSDHLENTHSCLSTTTPISMGNRSSPVPSMHGTLYTLQHSNQHNHSMVHLSILLIVLIFNIHLLSLLCSLIILYCVIFRLHALYQFRLFHVFLHSMQNINNLKKKKKKKVQSINKCMVHVIKSMKWVASVAHAIVNILISYQTCQFVNNKLAYLYDIILLVPHNI